MDEEIKEECHQFAECPFCGQIVALEELTPQSQCAAAAVAVCNCQGAEDYSRKKTRVQEARTELEALLGKEGEERGFRRLEDGEVLEYMKELIRLIGFEKIDKASFEIPTVGKLSIKSGSSSQIKIERQRTEKIEKETM